MSIPAAAWCSGLLLSLAAWAAPGDAVVEDHAKRVALTPPERWYFSEESDPDVLIFTGPKLSGTTASLRVTTLLDPRPLEALAADLFGTPGNPGEEWDASGPLFQLTRSAILGSGRAASRMAVALGRRGPWVTAFVFRTAERAFDAAEPDMRATVAGARPLPLAPSYRDEQLGLAVHAVPEGYAQVEQTTKGGVSANWTLEEGGRRVADVTVSVRASAKDAAAYERYRDDRMAALERDENVSDLALGPLPLCGEPAERISYQLSLPNGSRNAYWEVMAWRDGRVYVLTCGAFARDFERRREGFEAFLHGFALGDDASL